MVIRNSTKDINKVTNQYFKLKIDFDFLLNLFNSSTEVKPTLSTETATASETRPVLNAGTITVAVAAN